MADAVEMIEEDEGLPKNLVAAVIDAVQVGDTSAVDTLLDPLHPADIADLLEQVDQRDRAALLQVWKGGMDGDILSELGDDLREEVINALEPIE
ncbi:MAG TPA: magnesium transporter, partial [Octadecabacter sp.]|nr:magnesium transporter [Octadecabacter sp.]